jgi:hypothetical protein
MSKNQYFQSYSNSSVWKRKKNFLPFSVWAMTATARPKSASPFGEGGGLKRLLQSQPRRNAGVFCAGIQPVVLELFREETDTTTGCGVISKRNCGASVAAAHINDSTTCARTAHFPARQPIKFAHQERLSSQVGILFCGFGFLHSFNK